MFADQIRTALAAARSGPALDDINRATFGALAAGLIDDDTAQEIAEQVHLRRTVSRASEGQRSPSAAAGGFGGRASIFPPRRPQRPRLRAASIERRRRLASSGPLPPSLAAKFTVGEQAVLRIVGDEWRAHGACRLTLGEIAARAGCCRKLAQSTMRRAMRMGLVAIDERRLKGRPNLPNVVTVVCREWSAWLLRGPGIAGKKDDPTDTKFYPRGKRRAEPVARPDYRRGMQRPHGAGT
jgi:hypothetical protein